MGRVSQWAVRRPWYALLSWVGIMFAIGILGTRFGGDYNNKLPAAGYRVDDGSRPPFQPLGRLGHRYGA